MENLIIFFGNFFSEHSARILWIVVILVAGRTFLQIVANRIIKAASYGSKREIGKEKRAKTLAGLLITTGSVVLGFIVFVMMLQLFNVDATPIIAGASVLGFAIGFGAQTLIKDFLAGIFIFSENQFAIDDRVKIGQTEGTIFRVSMRSTVIRDNDGNLVFIPNGSITSVINYSLGDHRKKQEKEHSETKHETNSL